MPSFAEERADGQEWHNFIRRRHIPAFIGLPEVVGGGRGISSSGLELSSTFDAEPAALGGRIPDGCA